MNHGRCLRLSKFNFITGLASKSGRFVIVSSGRLDIIRYRLGADLRLTLCYYISPFILKVPTILKLKIEKKRIIQTESKCFISNERGCARSSYLYVHIWTENQHSAELRVFENWLPFPNTMFSYAISYGSFLFDTPLNIAPAHNLMISVQKKNSCTWCIVFSKTDYD